ncbi:MAG: ABC transporter ATP-binding protein [bacterium]|jgi:putative ABC transport system ATP-binding protein
MPAVPAKKLSTRSLLKCRGGPLAAPPDKAMLITLRQINKVYHMESVDVPALKNVSTDIAAGEFVAIMGHSGSGKSTLLNLLGCLDTPDSGSYHLDGEEVSKLDSDALAKIRNQKIGFVFQNFNLLPRTTAEENVELPLYYGVHMRSAERRKRARELLTRLGLEGRMQHHPGQLSGGQQQRVAIARALVNQPPLILADEPTGNLDSRSADDIMALFQELNKEGITIVMVTHEPDIARFAKRVIQMRDGEIV